MKTRTGTFEQFKEHTLAIARGERQVDPDEPKIWRERIKDGGLEHPPEEPAMMGTDTSQYSHSMLRERIVEHVFVGEALRQLWKRGALDVEVLRSEFDAGGYDLVMTYRKIVRHIQFKSVTEAGKATRVSVSLKLMEKPSGCVIWIVVSPRDLQIKSYRWLGEAPGEPLLNNTDWKVAKHTRANAEGKKLERANHRIVPLTRFEQLPDIDAVLDRLFGPLP
jgi:hypothetical protein